MYGKMLRPARERDINRIHAPNSHFPPYLRHYHDVPRPQPFAHRPLPRWKPSKLPLLDALEIILPPPKSRLVSTAPARGNVQQPIHPSECEPRTYLGEVAGNIEDPIAVAHLSQPQLRQLSLPLTPFSSLAPPTKVGSDVKQGKSEHTWNA
jgi:hypothetical protein